MISKKKLYNIKNRSAGMVVYKIPETGIRREWQPGEIKSISFGELEQLSYQPGGREMMANFLQVEAEEVTDTFGIERQPEYDMSEAQIIELIKTGPYEAFLDALDYAPIGVIDLIKKFSVSLPLTDMSKRVALKEKTGFDVDKAIQNSAENTSSPETEVKTKNSTSGRRTTPNYKVVADEAATDNEDTAKTTKETK